MSACNLTNFYLHLQSLFSLLQTGFLLHNFVKEVLLCTSTFKLFFLPECLQGLVNNEMHLRSVGTGYCSI